MPMNTLPAPELPTSNCHVHRNRNRYLDGYLPDARAKNIGRSMCGACINLETCIAQNVGKDTIPYAAAVAGLSRTEVQAWQRVRVTRNTQQIIATHIKQIHRGDITPQTLHL